MENSKMLANLAPTIPNRRKARAKMACTKCRQLKIRCVTGDTTKICQHCSAQNLLCVYEPVALDKAAVPLVPSISSSVIVPNSPAYPSSEQSSQTFEEIPSSSQDGELSRPFLEPFWQNPGALHELPYPSYSLRNQISNLSYVPERRINAATVALEFPYDDPSSGFPSSSGNRNALTSPKPLPYFEGDLSDYNLSCEYCRLDACTLHSLKFSYRLGSSTDDVSQTTLEGIIEDEAFEAESVTVRPKAGMVPRVSPPLTSDDVNRLHCQWKGGCVLSVHDSGLADDWLNNHYDDEFLVSLRANDIGGPVASMLSIDTPALTIFGLMSPQLVEMAAKLAQLSGFPVMIRPVTEELSSHPEYHESSSPVDEFSISHTNSQPSARSNSGQEGSHHSTSTQRPPGRDDNPNELSGDGDDRRHLPDTFYIPDQSNVPDLSSPDPSSAPNPSYPPDPDSFHREITHDTNICLKILLNGTDKGHFLELQTSVKFYPIPNEKEPLDSSTNKPKIEANIVRLKLLRSPSVEIDSATGSLGFLTVDESYLRFRDFVSLGHDEPPIKHAFIENKQRTKVSNVTAGLTGGKPMVTGAFTNANMYSTTTQAEEDMPSPLWIVKSEATEQNSNCYSTINAKIYRSPQLPMANRHPNIDLDVKYGMSVEVAYPIQKHTPKVSFLYRHQIHCWVAVESKARRRGIIVVAVNYIPDICTKRPLWIREYPKLNLVHNRSTWDNHWQEGDKSPRPQTSEGVFAFATATAAQVSTQTLGHSWRHKIFSVWPKAQKPEEQVGEDITIPIHTHIRRGWEHTDLEWQKAIWPKLDCDLQHLRGESTAALRLDWRGVDDAEDIIMEEP